MAYCSFATVFIAQACNIHLSIGEQITMLLILMFDLERNGWRTTRLNGGYRRHAQPVQYSGSGADLADGR
ncbi:hypothetical protein [Escherichia coli]